MRKVNVKHFRDEQSLTRFVDKALARRKAVSIQPTTHGYTVCY